MIPAFGLRWICRTGVPGRSAQGTVCRSRSGIPCRFRYWGTMAEPRWPQREAGDPPWLRPHCLQRFRPASTPIPAFGRAGMIRGSFQVPDGLPEMSGSG